MSRVLGIDPGFAAVGWAVVDLSAPSASGEQLIALGVLRTRKTTRKQNVLAAADNFRRARELGRALSNLVHEHHVDAICAEAMSFPRSSSVAAKMAMCWGVLAQICEAFHLPLAQASPQDIKRAVTGSASASKDDVEALLCTRYPDAAGLLGAVPGALHEHAFDAAGAVVACRNSEVIAAVTRQLSHNHPLQNVYARSVAKGGKSPAHQTGDNFDE